MTPEVWAAAAALVEAARVALSALWLVALVLGGVLFVWAAPAPTAPITRGGR